MERKIESKIILSRYSNETVKDDLYIGLDIADLQLEEIPQNVIDIIILYCII